MSSISANAYPAAMESAVVPDRAAARLSSVDMVRGIALLGILVVNIDSFMGPIGLHDIPVGTAKDAFSGPHAALNYLVLQFKWALIENKMRGLFAMLFGASIILYSGRLERAPGGEEPAVLYMRRNMWLALFGLLHGVFLWEGDILLTYALNALVFLYPCRALKPRTLLIVGTLMWSVCGPLCYFNVVKGPHLVQIERQHAALQSGLSAGTPLTSEQEKVEQEWTKLDAPYAASADEVSQEVDAHHKDGYGAVLDEGFQFIHAVARRESFGVFFEPTGAALVGMALLKSGFLRGTLSLGTYLLTAAIGLLLSTPATVWSISNARAHGFSSVSMLPVEVLALPTAEAGAIAIAAVLLALFKSGKFDRVLRPFMAVGRTALSNYLLTSLICQTLFTIGPWRLFGELDYYQGLYVVAGVWAVNLIASSLWMRFFKFGPFEWLWRSLTYWRLQPLRLERYAA